MALADSVTTFLSETKGKGMLAVKNIKNGDIIMQEKPLVCCQFSWNAAYKYLACDHCLRSLETTEENVRRLTGNPNISLPYPECCPTVIESHTKCNSCGIQYCSKECQELAWKQYHMTLCVGSCGENPSHPLNMLNETWKQMHYPPETTSIMLLARIIATVRQAEDKSMAMNTFMQFCHRTENEEEEIAHKLLGEQFSSQLEILRELMGNALYSDDVHHWLTPQGFRSLFALVGTNGQGVASSPLSQWVNNVANLNLSADQRSTVDSFIDQLYSDIEAVSGAFLDAEGSALYLLQSSCNHDCEPNAEQTFPLGDSCLVLKAKRDISQGEEVCVSYLDECALSRSRHSRQKILRENYLFTCRCTKCLSQADNESETSSDDDDAIDEDE
ncbi:histone-lysine N-trimethyltransferase SMYD5 [Ischnura elegans]|uniref:histone-lysine N-trimethyltransferase SMYD5 n=1 Tax=Ischnura elegans TaxID=197161 RepID=UPI001ED8B406|nr:histone-lysine N-trimethyltransferase SMYD5 [Ischnura elegans]